MLVAEYLPREGSCPSTSATNAASTWLLYHGKQELLLCFAEAQEVFYTTTELQNGQGWNGHLQIIWSKLPAQVRTPTAHYPGLCPYDFLSPWKETQQHLWAACPIAQSPLQ